MGEYLPRVWFLSIMTDDYTQNNISLYEYKGDAISELEKTVEEMGAYVSDIGHTSLGARIYINDYLLEVGTRAILKSTELN